MAILKRSGRDQAKSRSFLSLTAEKINALQQVLLSFLAVGERKPLLKKKK
ncbi:hypothetical protein CCACVL1_08396 [Corchorus capsularis]|uniref:Uncharacterized protein n=1 Tax=Corchorus capsularis TaxID=210143 RepID=A0A1R3J0R8_COCAP|nr:hypothetical protein CCACVL1_08396 [Corchorus capsularis]